MYGLLIDAFVLGASIYFLPLIVAYRRKNTDLIELALFNLLLGWSVVGWIAALLWARHMNVRGLIVRTTRRKRRAAVEATLTAVIERGICRDKNTGRCLKGQNTSNF